VASLTSPSGVTAHDATSNEISARMDERDMYRGEQSACHGALLFVAPLHYVDRSPGAAPKKRCPHFRGASQ
jgi:hypothetical protein